MLVSRRADTDQSDALPLSLVAVRRSLRSFRRFLVVGGIVFVAIPIVLFAALEGTAFKALGPLFKGPTAIAYSRDPVAAAKVAVEFANKNEKLTIVAGSLGERMLDVAGVKALATLPSLPEMRAKLLGTIVAPATRLATIVNAPGSGLARVINAYAKKA